MVPLQSIGWPLCSLEPIRRVFEAHATSRSSQVWTMNGAAFERALAPAAAEPAQLRALFASSCAARSDVGSGWDEPPAGQLTLFGFIEAVLALLEAGGERGAALSERLARVFAEFEISEITGT